MYILYIYIPYRHAVKRQPHKSFFYRESKSGVEIRLTKHKNCFAKESSKIVRIERLRIKRQQGKRLTIKRH